MTCHEHAPVIVRLVRNCALGRTIQYAALGSIANVCDYWMPRLRGA